MIVYQKQFIRIAETWNGEEVIPGRVDLVRRFQQIQPHEGTFCREFYSIVLDLKKDESALLAAMKRGTRYEIRRASAVNTVYEYWHCVNLELLEEFSDYFDRFAAQRAQPKLDRRRLSLLARDGAVSISRMTLETVSSEVEVIWHAYHRTETRATLLHSASLFRNNSNSSDRNRVGSANRLHHWKDILLFKAEGMSIYDFGGWYQGSKDRARLQINKFKAEFGGTIERTFICEHAVTLKAGLFLRLRHLFLGDAI